MKFTYENLEIEIVKQDDAFCYSFEIGKHLYLGQCNSYEEAIECIKDDIDHNEDI